MRKLLFAVLSLLCAASVARAQNTSAVSGSNVQDLSGHLLVSGSICFQGTNQFNIPISFQQGGGGSVITTPYCSSIANGVITNFNVANPANTSPVNIRYHIQIKAGSRILLDSPGAYLCNMAGACTAPYAFNFDNCFSSGACINTPVPQTTGPVGPTGPQGPTGPAGSGTSSFTLANASSTGTTVNKLVKVTGAPSTAVLTATTDTGGIQGICTSGCGTTGSATIQTQGGASCVFDGATTAGDYVQNSASVAGDCTDAGATYPISGQVLGVVLSTNVSGGLYNLTFFSAETHPLIGLDNTWQNNDRFKGPIPFVDITAFGARAVTSPPTTTATCVSTQNTCTFASVSGFQVGDGVKIRGRGATLLISTPSTSGFTVTPSLSSGGMGLGGGNYSSLTTVASGTGSTTYNYKLIARDKTGGYTAPSSAVTITNGLASLGAVTCAASTETRSGVLMTINFSSSCPGATQGAAFSFFGGSSATFSGFYNVKTVNSPTQIVVSGQYNSAAFGFQPGDSTQNSSTGGTATFVLSNHLAWSLGSPAPWEFYVCSDRANPGTYALVGVTKPSTAQGQDTQFDDYGSPYNDGQTYPSYITNSLCNGGSAQNDPSSSTITAINGTTVTLSDNATNSTTSTTATFDDTPGFLAAASTLGNGKSGTLLIPWTGTSSSFVFNSYLTLPQQISVHHVGTIQTTEPVEFGMQNWDGKFASTGVVQFGYSTTGGAFWSCSALPCIYQSAQGTLIENVSMNLGGNTNGGLIELDEAGGTIRRNMQYTVEGGVNGYLGTAVWFRLNSVSSDSEFHCEHCVFTVSNTAGTAWAPIIYTPIAQSGTGTVSGNPSAPRMFIEDSDLSIRGFERTASGGNALWILKNIIRQAGNAPLLWLQASNNRDFEEVILDHVVQDTDVEGTVAIGNSVGNPALSQVDIFAQDVEMSSSDTGGPVSPFTGSMPREIEQRYNSTARMPHIGFGTCPSSTNTGGGSWIRCDYDPILFAGPSAELFFPLAAPTVPTATAANGGSLNALTLEAAVTAVGVDGNESIISPTSSSATTSGTCPGSGNCEISLTWTAVPYAVSYNVYGCTTTIGPTCPSLAKQASGIATNAYTWTTLANNGSAPIVTGTGQSGHTATNVWAPNVTTVPQKFAALTACSATLTGYQATVTDSSTTTWGNTITGGSTNTVLAFCDGSNWTVYGK